MYLKIKSWDYLHIRTNWADIQQPVLRTERMLKKKIIRKLAKLKGCALFVALNSAEIDKLPPVKGKGDTEVQGALCLGTAGTEPRAARSPPGEAQRAARLLGAGWHSTLQGQLVQPARCAWCCPGWRLIPGRFPRLQSRGHRPRAGVRAERRSCAAGQSPAAAAAVPGAERGAPGCTRGLLGSRR